MRFTKRLICLAMLLAGCEPPLPPPPLPIPTSLLTVEYSAPFTSAKANPAITPENSLAVQATFIATEYLPQTNYQPLASQAVLFSSTDSGGAIMPTAELTRDATINVNPANGSTFYTSMRYTNAGRVAMMAVLPAALPAGVTVSFSALDPFKIPDPVTAELTQRSVVVQVTRPTISPDYQISLVIKDRVAGKDLPPGFRTETVTFNRSSKTPATAFIIPFQFYQAQSKAIAVLIQVSPASNDVDHQMLTAACKKELDTNPVATTQQVTGDASTGSAVTAALQSLKPVAGRRSALAFLAGQTNASICEDVAMEADDAVLNQLVQNLQKSSDLQSIVAASKSTDANIGWPLDLITLRLLSKLSDDAANGKGAISDELVAILTNHTGEVGRHSSSLEELLRGLTSRTEFETRLQAQNTIFLEDSSPVSRVRAYDWLRARHYEPAGFDPLGPSKARREALEKAAGAS